MELWETFIKTKHFSQKIPFFSKKVVKEKVYIFLKRLDLFKKLKSLNENFEKLLWKLQLKEQCIIICPTIGLKVVYNDLLLKKQL